MKESNREEESHFSSKSLLNKLNTVKTEKFIEMEDRSPTLDQNKISSIRESQTSFDKALINKVRNEEEELYLKKKMKENQRILGQIGAVSRKDYIVFFVILISIGLNYNILFFPFVFICIIYYLVIEKISFKYLKFRYFMEIFTLGYACYLLLYKIIVYSLLNSKMKSLIEDHKDFYLDYGMIMLKNPDNPYLLHLNFLPEINIIAVCGYGILVSFRCRLLKSTDQISKKITSIKITKYILFIYIVFVALTMYNLSYISLFYMLCIQIVTLLNSFKFHTRIMKRILKLVLNFLNIVIFIQIILTNIFNIPSNQETVEEFYSKIENKEGIVKYLNWKYFGIHLGKIDDFDDFIARLQANAFAAITLILLKNTLSKLNSDIRLEPSINYLSKNDLDNNGNKAKKAIGKVKGMFTNIISNIMMFLSHPLFNFELTRLLSIIWTYHYRNIYSLGIILFLFLSFFSIDIKKNKYLVIIILTPMLLLSLCSFHLANIDGLCEFKVEIGEDVDKETKEQLLEEQLKTQLKYRRYALGKYKHEKFEYWIGNLFYLIVMFLINSIYTAELSAKEDKNQNKKQIKENMKKSDIKESTIGQIKETTEEEEEEKSEDKSEDKSEEKSEEKKEEKNDEKNDEKNEILKKIAEYDTKNSINDNDDSFLLQADEDTKQSRLIENKIKNKILPKYNKKFNKDKNKDNVEEELSFSFLTLIIKGIFTHIDKITLVVMYLVSVNTVNAIHVILVFILIFQIISPGIFNKCYKIITLILQLLYFFEFVIDLLKVRYFEKFNEEDNKKFLQFFFVYEGKLESIDIEIFIYGVILCLYFQYTTCNIESIKNILDNKDISIKAYLKMKLKKHRNIQSFIFLIGNIGLTIYIWILIFAFIFFNSFFEINLIFGIKLIIFLICCYQFIYLIQTMSRNTSINCTILFNRILLFICCLNTLLVYLYQFLCKELLPISEKIKNIRENEDNFLINNLPNIGFTDYKEKDLYYNLLPHFITTFISVLYSWQSESILQFALKSLAQRRSTIGKQLAAKMEKRLAEKARMEKIKEEKNEFIQDKLYSDKYDENSVELNSKSKSLLKAYIIIFFTECYWLALFFAVGIIFIKYNLSFTMIIYVLIFGIISIIMFFRIIIKLTKYIKQKSYFISKVIRYSIVERPRNREINKKYRVITFRCLLFFSYLYYVCIYFYGIFGLFQHGCSSDIFKGCEYSFSPICEPEQENDDTHETIESKIKSFAFLFGIYFDVTKEYILKVALPHLILTGLIILDLYNQKLADYYSKLTETLTSDIQKLANENNVLQKYSDIADLNILIKIGLSIAGVDLKPQKGENGKRFTIMDKFKVDQNDKKDENIDNNDNLTNNENKEEDGDEPCKMDKPKKNISNCFNLNLKDPSNSFIKDRKIQKFIDMIKKSNENEQQLSLSNSKDRVIRFVKLLIEELIIFISLCLALSKLNIYTFVYFFVTLILIITKKTMFKYYLLYIFIFLGIIIQSLFFILNVNTKTSPRENDVGILDCLNKTMSIPLYKEHYKISERRGFFLGLGINKEQVDLIWLEFMQIIIIYLYLNYFSYSIYQDIINLGSSSLSDQKFDFETLNMNQGSLEQIKTMSDFQFFQLKECLACFNFNIGNTITEFFTSLKINKSISYINYFDTNTKKIPNLNLSQIKNPVLKQLIENRMYEKEYLNNLEKKKKGRYKPLPSYLLVLQQILYLYFHCFLLILIVMLSMMTTGVLSTIYFALCFYYLIKSDSIFLGQEYAYPKAIKTTLRIIVLIDIIMQGTYQLPYFSLDDDDWRFKISSAFGFIRVVSINEDEINSIQKLEIFGKALIYFLMSVQNLIYNSKTFKRYYLVYLLEKQFQTNKTSLVNAFTFNNERVRVYEQSLDIRQKSAEIMEDLSQIIAKLDFELNKMSEKIKNKTRLKPKTSPLEFIQNKEKLNEIEDNTDDNEKPKNYLKVDEIKERIKSMLVDKIITQVYLWLHKHSANYKNIDKDALNDFYIETIKGETKIKSIIEKDINTCLSIIDLTGLEKTDMKDIETIIESNFDEEKRKELELERLKEKLAQKKVNKFRKFGNTLLRLNRFAKMVYGQMNTGAFPYQALKSKEGVDIVELFRIKTDKERAEKEKKEKEMRIKRIKYGYIEELFDTKLFKKYLKTSYQLKHIFLYIQSLFMNNFTLVCYIFMIMNHMSSGSLISLVYPLSIFCYALLEYPRPKKSYWNFCLVYTMIIMFMKFILQSSIIEYFNTKKYNNPVIEFFSYKIGFKHFDSTFNSGFLRYIIFDGLTIFSLLINRNLLLNEGLWYKREEELENIYEATERISIYRTKKYGNKFEAIQDLLLKYIYTPREVINIRKNLEKNKNVSEMSKRSLKFKSVKHKFPFFGKRNITPEYDEANKSYFEKLLTRTRNEKPGSDYYPYFTLVMFLICIYILFFYTEMDQDKIYGSVNMDTTQFSGAMVIFLIFHIAILAYDRFIFVSQNRENIEYEYYFYKRNQYNKQGELISETDSNNLKNEIVNNDEKSKINKISPTEIKKLKKEYNIFFIQKERYNRTLLNKYVLHMITSIVIHLMAFFYFPMKGNSNLGIGIYCEEDEKTCNNFDSNLYIVFFYIFYIFYLFLSGLQIKYGYYDIKRKSLFKIDDFTSKLGNLFQAIPFLNEIKNAIDWTFTSTCFNLIQWIKFEAIYDTIFDTYCEKTEWDEKPVGERKSRKEKVAMGGSLAFILIIILIAPLILFSSLNPTNKLNNLNGAKITVDLTFNYENGAIKKYNIFENTRADSISEINETLWKEYNYSESVQTRNFNKEQVQRVVFSTTSDKNWDLAAPHIDNLISMLDLEKNNTGLESIELNLDYELTRPLPAEAQTCSNSFVTTIYKEGDNSTNNFIDKIRNALQNCSNTYEILDDIYCPPLRLTSGTEVNEIEDENYFNKRGIKIGFECTKEQNINYINRVFTINSTYEGKEEPLELHVFSDKISETTYGYSVLTFYISFVLLAGSYVREFLANEPEKIMLEELPHAKRIVELCEGIKIARYSYDFKTEEYLYTILIELLRSPDYLKIITDSSLDHFRMREELNEED